MFAISSFQYHVIAAFAYLVFAWVLISNTTWKQYIISWLLWNIYYNLLWSYFTSGILQTTRSYFNVVCYYYRLRLQDLNHHIIQVARQLTTCQSRSKTTKLNRILNEINDIFVSLEKSNEFWSKYIPIFYYLCNPLACFTINCLMYFSLGSGLTMFFIVLIINTTFTVMQILLSASSINYQAKLCSKNLMTILYFKNIPIKFRFKVTNNHYYYIIIILLLLFLISLDSIDDRLSQIQ